MSAVVIVVLGVAGLVAGAAIWVIATAQAKRRPLFGGPACDACGKPLPVTGWLPLWGLGTARRCRTCGARQPASRIAFELLVAIYFAAAAARLDDALALAATLVFAVPLLVILLVDLWTRFIYTNIIAVGILVGLIFALGNGLGALVRALAGGVIAVVIFGLFFLLAAVLYRNVRVVPFGLGDVYLAAMIGVMVRFPTFLTALFLGILLGGAAAVMLLGTRRLKRRDAFAYGPYLCLGALLTLLLG